jgi:hypothetical protein
VYKGHLSTVQHMCHLAGWQSQACSLRLVRHLITVPLLVLLFLFSCWA